MLSGISLSFSVAFSPSLITSSPSLSQFYSGMLDQTKCWLLPRQVDPGKWERGSLAVID
jgi:hypothetical protein